jgi:hypothetical protein
VALQRVPLWGFSFRGFLGTLRPLPETRGDLRRQATPQLARKHDDLASMMTFVCHEVRKDVPNIERKIAPHIEELGGIEPP